MTTEMLERHTMIIADPTHGTKTVEWNGEPEDRAKAEAIFKERMDTGLYLAYHTVEVENAVGGETTTRKEQITRDQFNPESETTWLAPRLVGG